MKLPLLSLLLAPRRGPAILALVVMAMAAFSAEPSAAARPKNPGEKVRGYVAVNGLSMYYEIIGIGRPTVYIHPILSHCGLVSKLPNDRQWIIMDLQGHGRTADIDRDITCEQDADDIAALLTQLGITQADILGVSFGGSIAVTMAVRHPGLVRRVASYGSPLAPLPKAAAATLKPEDPFVRWEREQYQKVAPDPAHWPTLFAKVLKAGTEWKGLSPDELKAIKVPVLLACGDHDLIPVARCVELAQMIPGAQLAVIPDASHFVLFSAPERLLPTVTAFFDGPIEQVPLATFASGYYPGTTR